MFRRTYWFTVGTAVGLGGSWWVTRSVRQAVARYTPERLSSDMADRIRGIGADLRLAVADGREAMLEREAQLRGDGPARDAVAPVHSTDRSPNGHAPRPVAGSTGRHARPSGRPGRRTH